MVLTTEDVWSEGAAGDPQVVGIFLCMELVHVQVPQTQVSIGGAGHEQLTTRAKGAGYHCCVIHCSSPLQTKPTAAASTNMPVSNSTSLLLFKYDNAGCFQDSAGKQWCEESCLQRFSAPFIKI